MQYRNAVVGAEIEIPRGKFPRGNSSTASTLLNTDAMEYERIFSQGSFWFSAVKLALCAYDDVTFPIHFFLKFTSNSK